ncbi:PAS domain-containing protein [Mycolicibacterium thermoresistibile]
MTHDWLLVETLGAEPAVAATGRRPENLVPISGFLRRNPHVMAVLAAIGESVRSGQGLSTITPKNDRVIRTEVVTMTDGRVHGVHVWSGPPDQEPPERPIPGALTWNLTTGVATHTPESLVNGGHDPEVNPPVGRLFLDALPRRSLTAGEARLLAMVLNPEPGRAVVTTWAAADHTGAPITEGFVARSELHTVDDGSDEVICRAMNWRADPETPAPEVPAVEGTASQDTDELAGSDCHRLLVDIDNWRVLKWLDEPPLFLDRHARGRGDQTVHPDDAREMARMTMEFVDGYTSGVLRLRDVDGGWSPVRLMVHRVELDAETYVGVVTLRRA